jgi:4-hydroxy-tetrahydrodipicolinate synthase
MAKALFTGTGTALITPFNPDGSIDFKTFGKLIKQQIDAGIEAIIVSGSTGEGATLSMKEKIALFVKSVEFAAGGTKIIAGTGSNDTQASIDLSLIAMEQGVDGLLLVAPYYNKPSQEGLFAHFKAIADTVKIPQIIYNVPSRAGVNISADTQIRLANACKNIVGTKEASGSIEQIMDVIRKAPAGFSVYAGDDAMAVPVVAMGGKGVISVISNYAPKEFGDAVRYALAGKMKEALKLHYQLFDLMQVNFIETNPSPVKAAMQLRGFAADTLRLPMLPVSDANREKILQTLKKAGLSVKRMAKKP